MLEYQRKSQKMHVSSTVPGAEEDSKGLQFMKKRNKKKQDLHTDIQSERDVTNNQENNFRKFFQSPNALMWELMKYYDRVTYTISKNRTRIQWKN